MAVQQAATNALFADNNVTQAIPQLFPIKLSFWLDRLLAA
jgi:hypothetical protein